MLPGSCFFLPLWIDNSIQALASATSSRWVCGRSVGRRQCLGDGWAWEEAKALVTFESSGGKKIKKNPKPQTNKKALSAVILKWFVWVFFCFPCFSLGFMAVWSSCTVTQTGVQYALKGCRCPLCVCQSPLGWPLLPAMLHVSRRPQVPLKSGIYCPCAASLSRTCSPGPSDPSRKSQARIRQCW